MILTKAVIKGRCNLLQMFTGQDLGSWVPFLQPGICWNSMFSCCAQVPLDLAEPEPMDYEPCTQPKTALPAQLDSGQAQQHENILCFGALVEISLMRDTLDLLLHELVIYYKAMEVKETCNLHLFNKEGGSLCPVTVLPVLDVLKHKRTKLEK